MRKLYRLFYRSRQTTTIIQGLDTHVRQILQSSMRNNKDDGLTGHLATIQDCFVRALEGLVESVRSTYARISRAPRRRGPHFIAQGTAEGRLFSDWTMCSRFLAPSDNAILDVVDAKGKFDPMSLTPHSVQSLLISVATIHRRTNLDALVAAGRH